MTIDERNNELNGFFNECRDILDKKGRHYNPDGVAFSEVREIAADVGIKPEQVLMVFANKHWQAVKAHAKNGQVASEPIRERLKDMANYMALYAVMNPGGEMTKSTSYMGLVQKTIEEGFEELNKRTGLKTRRIFGAIVDLEHRDSIFSPRRMFPKTAAAEATWMLMGDQSTAWISKHTKIWAKFEDEGLPGFISTAYGYRLRTAFGRDQIQEAVELIQRDPSSRQCLLLNWDPRVDGLMNQGKSKNVPCPFSFQLLVKNGFGHMVVFQRSADVIIGIPYDLLYYYILGQALFNTAGYPFQGVRIMIADCHVYENLYHVADRMTLAARPFSKHLLRHSWKVAEILREPDGFVEEFVGKYKHVNWPMTDKLEAAL